MRAPGIATRIGCALVGAVAAPAAVGLISTGGEQWARMRMRYGFDAAGLPFDRLVGPTLLMLLGLILLTGVVLTGLLSAAGLVAAGVVGIAPLIATIAPGAAIALVRARLLPGEALGQLYAGVPVAVLPLLGFMGVTLLTLRRTPRQGSGSTLLGAVIALVALTVGGSLLMWGVQAGVGRALIRFDSEVLPLPALLVLGGVALIAVGTIASRWSPYALVLPAAVLLVLGVVNLTSVALFRLPLHDVAQPTAMFLLYGGGVAVAVAQIAFTAVLLLRRRRIRRGAGSSIADGDPRTVGGPGDATNAVPRFSPAAPGYPRPATPDAPPPAPAPPTPPVG